MAFNSEVQTIVKNMLEMDYTDPCFIVDIYNLGRGFAQDNNNLGAKLKKTIKITCWKIIDNKLEQTQVENVFFDEESYIVEWKFQFEVEAANKIDETVYFHWKGSNASKSFSPLPQKIQKTNTIVTRICQWSEPAIFFQVFSPNKLIVFSGSDNNFNTNKPRLFMVRGELENEIHLYELPCKTESLRSRTIFLIVIPAKQVFIYWYGAQTMDYFHKLISTTVQPHRFLLGVGKWEEFAVLELKEGNESDDFLETVIGSKKDYFSFCGGFSKSTNSKLFYLNSITGNFSAAIIEYDLKNKLYVAPFHFLQTHLYTASQPALFLLDNEIDVWLWTSWNTEDSTFKEFQQLYDLAKEILNKYAKEKEKVTRKSIKIKQIQAGLEPLEFTNLFPYWIYKNR